MVSFVLLTGGCSFLTGDDGLFRDRKKDYRKAESTERMQVPPQFDSNTIIDHYPVPPANPYALQELIDKPPMPSGMLVDTDEKVRLQKLGEREWVLVQVSPSQLWPRLKEFVIVNRLQQVSENGRQGTMTVAASDGFYRFRVEQGFQHNYAELSVRFSNDPAVLMQWPQASLDAEKESALLLEIARFFADNEKPSYSYAAHNISTDQRLLMQYDDAGNRYLLLKADPLRVRATLQAALLKAEFTEREGSEPMALSVQFMPQGANKKPGFWQRLFRIKPKPYDDSVEYAGHQYRFVISTEGDYQRLQVERLNAPEQSAAQQQKELNQQLLRIKGLLI